MENMPVYDNRELSWLKFNQRVLEEAEDITVPLYQRLVFVSIFCSNLDEFFMIRVGTLYDQTLLKKEKEENKTNLTPSKQLKLITAKVGELIERKDIAYESIKQSLAQNGVVHCDFASLTQAEKDRLEVHFINEIKPLLFTGLIDKKHPMPFFKNGEVYIAAALKRKDKANSDDKTVIGVLPAMGNFSRVIFLDGEQTRFLLAEDLIFHLSHLIFDNFEVISKTIFRITRNADIDVQEALYDQDVDFRDVMEELLKKRKKLYPLRLEFFGSAAHDLREKIRKRLDIKEEYVYIQKSPLDMSFVFQLEDKIAHRQDLFYEKLTSQKSPFIVENEPMIKQIQRNDILLHYPYEKFSHFEELLREAAEDSTVVSIKITLYRVARDSKIVSHLIRAAENGKDVLALVELRARFDEENNIGWSKRLEQAGVNVIYGLDELKVHSKLLLITRKVGNAIYYITQIGTGNYNEKTSRLYTDFSLLTADKDIGAEASMVFNALSMSTTVESAGSLLVAPNAMKSRIVTMIDNEITYGTDGYIGLKLNSLTDKDIIEKLIEASKNGVKIELIIRGICCLIAGVDGSTENITVTSIVGRFLEHSRMYIFGKDERQRIYISSADFMTRNTERRVEVAVPIKDKAIKERLFGIFQTMLQDNIKARVQLPNGTYVRKTTGSEPLDTQVYFYKQAYLSAKLVEMIGKKPLKKRITSALSDMKDKLSKKNKI